MTEKRQKRRNKWLTAGVILTPMLAQLIMGIVIGIISVASGSTDDIGISPVALFITEIVSLILVVLMLRKYRDMRAEEKRSFGLGMILVGVLGILSAQGVMSTVADVMGKMLSFKPTDVRSQLSFMDQSELSQVIITMVIVVILAPIIEEVGFRRMLYNELRTRLNVPLSMLISAALFGFIHFDISISIGAFGMGLWLAYIYERFHNIVLNILTHGILNGMTTMLMLIYGDELPDASTETGDLVYGLMVFIIMLVISVFAVEYITRKAKHERTEEGQESSLR